MRKPIKINIREPFEMPVTEGTGGMWHFHWPDFDQQAIEEFKKLVPAEYRGYEPTTYEWSIHEEYLEELEQLVYRTWYNAEIGWY